MHALSITKLTPKLTEELTHQLPNYDSITTESLSQTIKAIDEKYPITHLSGWAYSPCVIYFVVCIIIGIVEYYCYWKVKFRQVGSPQL